MPLVLLSFSNYFRRCDTPHCCQRLLAPTESKIYSNFIFYFLKMESRSLNTRMRTPTTSLTRTFVLDRYVWTDDEFVFMDEVTCQIMLSNSTFSLSRMKFSHTHTHTPSVLRLNMCKQVRKERLERALANGK